MFFGGGSISGDRRLFDELLAADTEDDVVAALSAAGYWDDDRYWRLYGDQEDNFSVAGAQQRNPEAALVEKAINSVDACLMGKALAAGIDPRSAAAPKTTKEAVAIFYEGAQAGSIREYQGDMANWTTKQQLEVARSSITIALTGARRSRPSISIADAGEGQNPDALPMTILSLMRGNKKAISFVQGKFNMGGTGALRFCGRRNLQLVVSKRDPSIPGADGLWGFTVVRRDDPRPETRVSTYRYLAPRGSNVDPRRGGVLTLGDPTLPIFPEGPRAYARERAWGTLIKLYEYDTRFKDMFFRKNGLLERLDAMMPGLILPIRLYECRDVPGTAGSYETTLTGLEGRLAGQKVDPQSADNSKKNLEPDFPSTGQFTAGGGRVTYSVYAFRPGKAETYRKTEGVLFVVNGQAHGAFSHAFFRRRSVGHDYLADSLLVVVDCSNLPMRTLEDLFMNSRDELADSTLKRRFEDELSRILKEDGTLDLLKARRRAEETARKFEDARPVEDVLRSILSKSPALARLFLGGQRLADPFSVTKIPAAGPFQGRRHPSYFRLKGHPYGKELRRVAHLQQRLRIAFETDVANDYFRRSDIPGRAAVAARIATEAADVEWTLNLHDGIANLNVELPAGAVAGSELFVEVRVGDDTLVQQFINIVVVRIAKAVTEHPGGTGRRDGQSDKNPAGRPQDAPGGISLPNPTPVPESDWPTHGMTARSALRVKDTGEGGEAAIGRFDFFLNIDNQYLLAETRARKANVDLLKARYRYGMTLVGMGAIQHAVEQKPDGGTEADEFVTRAKDLVAAATDAIAPLLLPLIDALGDPDLGAALDAREDDAISIEA